MRKVLFIFGVLNESDIDWWVRAGSRRGIRRQDVLIDEGVPIDSIVQMAASYVGAIRSVEPDGPYRLVGWSAGGVLLSPGLAVWQVRSLSKALPKQGIEIWTMLRCFEQRSEGTCRLSRNWWPAIATRFTRGPSA